MLTGSSIRPRLQAVSQRWLQMRPQMPGNGLSSLMTRSASCEAALADEGDVALGPLAGRAGVAAGGDPQLLDGVGVRDGLRVELVGGAPLRQALVERVRDDDGADRGAVAAADALGRVDVARLVAQGDGEIAGLAVDAHHLGLSSCTSMLRCRPVSTSLGLMVHMAQSLVGKVLSSCAICPPMATAGFDQVNAETLVGQIEAGLHPGDSAAHNENSARREGVWRAG